MHAPQLNHLHDVSAFCGTGMAIISIVICTSWITVRLPLGQWHAGATSLLRGDLQKLDHVNLFFMVCGMRNTHSKSLAITSLIRGVLGPQICSMHGETGNDFLRGL